MCPAFIGLQCNVAVSDTSNPKGVFFMIKEPFKYYYRSCLLLVLVLCFPVSLLLLFRIYKIFIKNQPAIDPQCQSIAMKIGKNLLVVSQLFSVLSVIAIGGVVFILINNLVAVWGNVPIYVGGVLVAIFLMTIFPAILFIELSQISYRKMILNNMQSDS